MKKSPPRLPVLGPCVLAEAAIRRSLVCGSVSQGDGFPRTGLKKVFVGPAFSWTRSAPASSGCLRGGRVRRSFPLLQRPHPHPPDTGLQLAASGRGGSSRGASRRQHICLEPALRGTVWPVGAAVQFAYERRRISVLLEVKARAFGSYVLRTDGRIDGLTGTASPVPYSPGGRGCGPNSKRVNISGSSRGTNYCT